MKKLIERFKKCIDPQGAVWRNGINVMFISSGLPVLKDILSLLSFYFCLAIPWSVGPYVCYRGQILRFLLKCPYQNHNGAIKKRKCCCWISKGQSTYHDTRKDARSDVTTGNRKKKILTKRRHEHREQRTSGQRDNVAQEELKNKFNGKYKEETDARPSRLVSDTGKLVSEYAFVILEYMACVSDFILMLRGQSASIIYVLYCEIDYTYLKMIALSHQKDNGLSFLLSIVVINY